MGETKGIINVTTLEDDNSRRHGDNWWYIGPWKPPVLQEPLQNDSLFRIQNPDCKHDRTSDSQINCEACATYSAIYLSQWRKEKSDAPQG